MKNEITTDIARVQKVAELARKAKATKKFDLVPTNGRKSFYGKAQVVMFTYRGKKHYLLKSYDEAVACIVDDQKYTGGKYSSTTSAHQKSFFESMNSEKFRELLFTCIKED